MPLTIGADPELFVVEGSKFHSAYGLIPGTKSAPHKVENGAVQVDGMALEFNIDPASDQDVFVYNTNSVLEQLRAMVPEQYDLSIVSSAHFDPKHMAEQPKVALLLGCDPDFNAYTGMPNPSPAAPPTLRTAAGHIHLGWGEFDPNDPGHVQDCCELVKQLDVTLGMCSIHEDESGQERRQLYGKAGAFRPKPYGLEYRVLSNYWLLTERHMRDVYQRTQTAFDCLMNGRDLAKEVNDLWADWDVEKIINENDNRRASAAMRNLGLVAY